MLVFTRRYRAALLRSVSRPASATARTTTRLGRQAVALGLDTLQLASIHGEALASVLPVTASHPPLDGTEATELARAFFTDVVGHVEQTHRGVLEAREQLHRARSELQRAHGEMAAARRALQKERERRAAVERSLAASEERARGLLAEARTMQDQMRLLARRTLTAQEEERKEISRELHDEIAQTLSAINVHLAALAKEASVNTTGLKRKIAHAQRFVEKSVGVVHRFARDLRPTVLDNLGLIPALQSYIKDFTLRSKIPARLTAYAGVERLSNAKRTVLYRVAQEALTNVERHSRATRVTLAIERRSGVVRMKIADNGVSFDADNIPHARKARGLGLLGMRERMAMVGGTLTITASPGHGTTIGAEIPLRGGDPR